MTTMHPDTAYWDRGVANVPDMTGCARIHDARDLRAVLAEVGVALPLFAVLDVGCGTGRAAQLCNGYIGVDITPAAVEYCAKRGLAAQLVTGPDDLPEGPFGTVLCISVFTHVSREERRAYLKAFAKRSRRVLADIFPGDGTGTVAMWTAVASEYVADLRDAGFTTQRGPVAYKWPIDVHTDWMHTYYWAERA